MGLRMAAVCAVMMLAGCASGVQQAEISRAKDAQDLAKKFEQHFAEVQGRFTEAHIQGCLDARRKAGLDITLTGKPLYQANYFYTCVANTEARTQAFVEQAPGRYSIVYSVRAPIRRHPKLANASAAESNAKTQWYYLARCSFKVDEKTISYQEDLKPEVFIPYAGGGVKAQHIYAWPCRTLCRISTLRKPASHSKVSASTRRRPSPGNRAAFTPKMRAAASLSAVDTV